MNAGFKCPPILPARLLPDRFVTFTITSYPVIAHYSARGKTISVSCLGDPESVYEQTQIALDQAGIITYKPKPKPAPPRPKAPEEKPRGLLLPLTALGLWVAGWTVPGSAG